MTLVMISVAGMDTATALQPAPIPLAALDRTVLVANRKGGVGKSSIVAALAGMVARPNARVLVVDADPQGNVSEMDLGVDTDRGRGLGMALTFAEPLTPVRDVRPGLDVISGGPLLTRVPTSDPTLDVAENFRASLDALCAQEGYSLVLLDSGPGDTALLDAMMATARYLLVPTMDDHASLKGLELIAARYVQARQAGARIDLLGVVLFGLNPRASRRNQAAMDTVDEMLEGSGAERFDTFIRHDKAAAVDLRARGLTPGELVDQVTAETSARLASLGKGESVDLRDHAWSRDPSKLAIDYRELAREVLRRIRALEEGAQP